MEYALLHFSEECAKELIEKVLILVLMEYALLRKFKKEIPQPETVLILVLMEYALLHH